MEGKEIETSTVFFSTQIFSPARENFDGIRKLMSLLPHCLIKYMLPNRGFYIEHQLVSIKNACVVQFIIKKWDLCSSVKKW